MHIFYLHWTEAVKCVLISAHSLPRLDVKYMYVHVQMQCLTFASAATFPRAIEKPEKPGKSFSTSAYVNAVSTTGMNTAALFPSAQSTVKQLVDISTSRGATVDDFDLQVNNL